jgi:hypothetical protein
VVQLKKFPNYLNSNSQSTYDKLGEFDYEKHNIIFDSNYPILGPYLLEDNCVYFG